MRPFTLAEAAAASIDRRQLRGGSYRRIFRGIYVSAGVEVGALMLAVAALKVSPHGSHASHFTAAQILGGIVPDQPLTHVCSPVGASRCQRRGVKGHECVECHVAPGQTTPLALVRRGGVLVSGPERVFLELAGPLNLVDLVVLGDSLVARKLTTGGALVAAADGWSGPGARLARRAARYVRAGVDSPMETRLRMLIVLAGLPEPEVNHIIRDENGGWVHRFDLCYPHLRLVIEYDGRQHANDDQQWGHDIDRREELDRGGWRLLVVRHTGIYREPGRTLDRILGTMRELGARELPTELSDEWRARFPGRPGARGAQRAG
jgi:hypothetical protein